METTRVVVVGAGPIGIEVAAALNAEGMDYIHLEAGAIGSTFGWWAPETKFFSSPERIEICGVPLIVPGEEKATREQYMAYLRGVVEQLGLEIRTHERVVDVERVGDGFRLRTAGPGGEREIACEKLVLAIGNMHGPRLLGIPGEDLATVSHYLAAPHEYYGRRVLIVGGKNSACEAAIRLHRAGVEATVSYWRSGIDADRVKYWIRPELEWLISKGKIGFLPETAPVRIEPGRVELERVAWEGDAPRMTGERVWHETDFTLALTGYVQDRTLFDRLGLDLFGEEQRPRHDPDTMESSVPGVYVAGTACGGSQRRTRVFIETSHTHAARIVGAIAGRRVEVEEPRYGGQEEA